MSKKPRNITRNSVYSWDKQEERDGTILVPGDLNPIPERAAGQKARNSFMVVGKSIHLEGSVGKETMLQLQVSTRDKSNYTITIDGEMDGVLVVHGNTEVRIGGSVNGYVIHYGTGDITVAQEMRGNVSGKGKLKVDGTIHQGAVIGYDITHITAHEIETGVDMSRRTVVETEIPRARVEPVDGTTLSEEPRPSASIDPTEGGTANKRGRRK